MGSNPAVCWSLYLFLISFGPRVVSRVGLRLRSKVWNQLFQNIFHDNQPIRHCYASAHSETQLKWWGKLNLISAACDTIRNKYPHHGAKWILSTLIGPLLDAQQLSISEKDASLWSFGQRLPWIKRVPPSHGSTERTLFIQSIEWRSCSELVPSI